MGVVVEDSEVWREAISAGALGQVAGPAGRVVVGGIDVDVATGADGVVVLRPGFGAEVWIIVEERQRNRGRADGAFEELHVVDACGVGGFGGDVGPLVAIFVLDLVEDYVASISNCMREDNFGHLLHVRLPSSGVSRVVVAKGAIVAGSEPPRESSCVCFCVNVRPWSEDYVEANVFGDLEKAFEIVSSGFEVQDAVLGRVPSPTCRVWLEEVRRERVHFLLMDLHCYC